MKLKSLGIKAVRKTVVLLLAVVFSAGISGCGEKGADTTLEAVEEAENSVAVTSTEVEKTDKSSVSEGAAENEKLEEVQEEISEEIPKEVSEEISDVQEWKNIYYEYLKDTDSLLAQHIIVSKENAGFCFYEWPGHEAPVLCVQTGAAASSFLFMLIKDKEVVNFASAGKGASGYIFVSLIDDTDYYLIGGGGVVTPWGDPDYEGTLYDINDAENEIWSICWEAMEEFPEALMSDGYTPKGTPDEPYCMFRGEQLSKEEANTKIDELLGNGAAAQLIGVVGADIVNGPLSYTELPYFAGADDIELYEWEQLEEVFQDPDFFE